MDKKMPLLSSKFKMPQPRNHYIIRESLFEKLASIRCYKLILIKGIAGSGKTTLVSTFAKERLNHELSWLSLDESCDNIYIFWHYFIECLGGILGEAKETLLEMIETLMPKYNIEKLLVLLINGLTGKRDVFIALDDFYTLSDELLKQSLEFFFKNVSDNVHMIIITRYDLPIYIGSLYMNNQVLLIEDCDLKLSAALSIKFLKETLNLDFDIKTLESLNTQAEGWIGGLQLLALSAKGKSENAVLKASFSHPILEEYLRMEMIENTGMEEKMFLTVTSIPDYFDEEIACALLGAVDFHGLIESLMKKNILLVSIDEKEGIYRYHNLLKHYLLERFNELDESFKKACHLKAAAVLNKKGDYSGGIRHLLSAKAYKEAMDLILDLPQNLMFSFFDRIPETHVYDNPDYAFQCLFYYFINMEFTKCNALCQIFTENRENIPYAAIFQSYNLFIEDTYKTIDTQILSLNDIEGLPLRSATKALLLIKEATLLSIRYRLDEAEVYIESAARFSEKQQHFYIKFFLYSIKTQILEMIGDLNGCIYLYKDMERLLQSRKSLSMPASYFYLGITGVYLRQMELDKAFETLSKMKDNLPEEVLSIDRGYKYNLAEYQFLTGHAEEGEKLVSELITMNVYKDLIYIAPLLRYVFRLNHYTGTLVEQFRESYAVQDAALIGFDSKLLYARILFYEQSVTSALEKVDEVLQYARIKKIKLVLVEASLIKMAMIFKTADKRRDIINLFREAVFYGHHDQILLPFFLEKAVVSLVSEKFEREILTVLNAQEKLFYQKIKNICLINNEVLSEREKEVIKEMAQGFTNKEIAFRLCISLATVKSHIINIYGKLEVNNRVSAIETAKKRGILE